MDIGEKGPGGGAPRGGPRIGLGGIPGIPGGGIMGGANVGRLGGPPGTLACGVPCVLALYLGNIAICSSLNVKYGEMFCIRK